MSEDLVRIATFSYPIQAQLAKLRLDAEGISSAVFDESVPTLWVGGPIEGVRLMVRRPDAPRAAEILREKPPALGPEESTRQP